VDSTEELTVLSLCTGYGGIEMGLERLGLRLRPVAFVEREAFAAANLVAKIEAGMLAPAPVHSDVKTFPYGRFRGLVDIMLAGYPCQPFSAAGQRRGSADSRHLWNYIADGIAACRPGHVFAENVEGHVTLGLRDVLSDLGRMGYRTTWGLFSAAEEGAPHQRKRVFILAELDNTKFTRLEGHAWSENNTKRWSPSIRPVASPGLPQHEWEEPRTVVDSNGNAGFNVRRQEPGQQASLERLGNPSDTKPQNGAREKQRQAEPELGRTTDGNISWMDATANWVDRLRLLGNGVMPATAAKAFATLSARLDKHLK
jgi:DNA (cytosine-5)-methyltransferase 1